MEQSMPWEVQTIPLIIDGITLEIPRNRYIQLRPRENTLVQSKNQQIRIELLPFINANITLELLRTYIYTGDIYVIQENLIENTLLGGGFDSFREAVEEYFFQSNLNLELMEEVEEFKGCSPSPTRIKIMKG